MLLEVRCPEPQCMLCTLLTSTNLNAGSPAVYLICAKGPICKCDSQLCCDAARSAAAALRCMPSYCRGFSLSTIPVNTQYCNCKIVHVPFPDEFRIAGIIGFVLKRSHTNCCGVRLTQDCNQTLPCAPFVGQL